MEPTINIYRISNLPNFDTIRKTNLSIFMYKLKHNMIKSDLTLTLNSEVHSYSTRISSSYRIDLVRTNFGKFAILQEAIHIFNGIPQNLKLTNNLLDFKKSIKMYFMSQQNT